MDEDIIGRPFLTALGLDVARHLDNVREQFDNKDFSEFTSAHGTGSLSRIMLQRDAAVTNPPVSSQRNKSQGPGPTLSDAPFAAEFVVRHGEADDDPVYLPTAFPELWDTQSDEEALVIQAKDNGTTEPGAITLRALVHQFRDI
jgi:hypothetical protein